MIKNNGPALTGKTINTNSIVSSPSIEFKGDTALLNLSPLKSIRRYCLDCMSGSAREVSLCTRDGKRSFLCPLFRFRFGHNPSRAGIGGNADALRQRGGAEIIPDCVAESAISELSGLDDIQSSSDELDGANGETER